MKMVCTIRHLEDTGHILVLRQWRRNSQLEILLQSRRARPGTRLKRQDEELEDDP